MLLIDGGQPENVPGDCRPTDAWQILQVAPGESIVATFERHRPDAIALQIDRTPGVDLPSLEAWRERHPDVIFIALLREQSAPPEPLRALIIRVFDAWLPWPDTATELLACVRHVDRMNQLRRGPECELTPGSERYGLHGESAALRRLLATIERFKGSDAPVLIIGETGTGKELVARALHEGSPRASGPLIAVNCGAIPHSLIQSELFGHERNAFTGAAQRRSGSFEAANNGSVFLDEIGELPLEMQPALLRVLQERSVTRLGSTRPIPVDFRLIAATHVDLPSAVAAGQFREDLLFRINVLTVHVPALRDREDDVMVLAGRFLERFATGAPGNRPRGFSQDAIRALGQHRWPGNVRELINRVQRAVLMADGRLITAADLGFYPGAPHAERTTLAQARSHFERGLIRETLRETGHCMTSAARRLGVSRVTLYRMVERLGLGNGAMESVGVDRGATGGLSAPVSELKPGRFIS